MACLCALCGRSVVEVRRYSHKKRPQINVILVFLLHLINAIFIEVTYFDLIIFNGLIFLNFRIGKINEIINIANNNPISISNTCKSK